MPETTDAALVVFGWTSTTGEEGRCSLAVPANLLWSAEGLGYLFQQAREAILVTPESGLWVEGDEDVWDSFHVVSMQEESEHELIVGLEPSVPDAPVPGGPKGPNTAT